MSDRKSEAEIPALIEDPIELAEKEAANALAQFDWAMSQVESWVQSGTTNFKVSMLLDLHRKAMEGIDKFAGNFRPASVAIKGSNHTPIAGDDVPRYVEEMLDYLEENWEQKTALHLASYAMWRLNWIHPFADGNGRTSRMLSYMVLCARLEQVLPGALTIPEQISIDKPPYYAALEDADKAYKKGSVDLTSMERLLEGYLANQLLVVHEAAKGENSIAHPNNPGEQLAAKKVRDTRPWQDRNQGWFAIVAIVVALIFGVLTLVL